MKRISLFIVFIVFPEVFAFTQSSNTIVFTIFTSGSCGCNGSGGATETFTTNEEVLDGLREAYDGMDFILFEGFITAAYNEVDSKNDSYDGVLIIGRVDGD